MPTDFLELVAYIEQMKKKGYSRLAVEENLRSYGYNSSAIDVAFTAFDTSGRRLLERTFTLLCVAAFVMILVWLAFSTQSTGTLIVIGFLPSVLSIIATIIMVEVARDKGLFAIIFPLVGS